MHAALKVIGASSEARHVPAGESISGINPNIEKYKKFSHVDHLTAAGIARGVKAPGSKM